VIVVGAGIVGASIAWHLARAGARVTVVDAGGGGGLATPRSWAWINASWGNPEPYFRLRIRSMREWRRLEGEVSDLAVNWCGGLLWDLPPVELERFIFEHASWGYGIRLVEREEALLLEPMLKHPPQKAAHVPEEGAVEPAEAALTLLRDAERRGALLRLGIEAKGLASAGARVIGVETGGGRIEADHVVLAAGVATAKLAESVGVAVPLDAPAGLLIATEPADRLLNGLVLAPELHMRQLPDGRILAGTDFGGADPGADPDNAAAELFAALQEALKAELRFGRHGVGHRPTPRDGFPIVGPAQGAEGLTLAVTHSGVTLAPALGLFVADEVLTGRRDPLLAPYGLERFG
jgi:glycine/D-amino acid oxidase-like deaminating enzyme